MEQTTQGFVEEVVELFDLTGWDLMREAMTDALTSRGPAEMAEQFGRIEALLRGLDSTSEEALGVGATLVLDEARQLALTARHICEQYAT